MKEIISNILKSLDNKSQGYSGKKLTALAIVICIIAAHVKWIALGDFSQLVPVLTCDFAFVSVLFGINVVDKKQNPSEPSA